jgi:hypothetical protein
MCASVFRTLIGLSIGFTAAALAQVGLFIIAIFYGDPLNPTRPEYLGVVGVCFLCFHPILTSLLAVAAAISVAHKTTIPVAQCWRCSSLTTCGGATSTHGRRTCLLLVSGLACWRRREMWM